MNEYYKFTTPSDVAKKAKKMSPSVEGVTGAMNDRQHRGSKTRVWASEFGSLEKACDYISRNMAGPLKFSVNDTYLELEQMDISDITEPSDAAEWIKSYGGDSYGLLDDLSSKLLTANFLEKLILDLYRDNEYPRQILLSFPKQAFTPKVVKLLLTKDPDTIFCMPDEILSPKLVTFAIKQSIELGGFTSPPSDGGIETISEYFKPEILNDKNVQTALRMYDEANTRWEDNNVEWSKQWQKENELKKHHESEEKKQQLEQLVSKLSHDGLLIGKIPKELRTPEMIVTAIQNNPKSIFQIDSDQRTKDRWLLALKGNPALIEFVRPLDLQAEIKDEMNVKEDLNRIKKLGGL